MTEGSRGSVKIEPGRKRVRVYLEGELVADTLQPILVWELPYYPVYYIPAADVRADLIPAGQTEHSPSRGDAELLHVKVAATTADRAARRYPDSPLTQLRELVRFEWNAMSEWFEEDEPICTHARPAGPAANPVQLTRRGAAGPGRATSRVRTGSPLFAEAGPGRTAARRQRPGCGLRLAQHAQDVAAGESGDFCFAPAPGQQLADQRRVAGDVLQAVRQLVGAVIVTAEADMSGPRDRPDVIDVVGHVPQGGVRLRVRLRPLADHLLRCA